MANALVAESLLPLLVDVASLREDPRNARTHSERNLEALQKSLIAYGQRKPIVVNRRTMTIEAGNGLVQAAKVLGWTEVAAVMVDDDPANATGFALMDNQSALLAEWDMGTLKDLLQELETGAFEMSLTGFSDKELEELMTQVHPGATDDDAVPETPPAICQPGQLWQLGAHRLLCGDATKREDVERLMGGEKADMVFTDPPYAVNYGHDQKELQKMSGGKFSKTRAVSQIQNDNLKVQDCADRIWGPAFGNMFEMAKDDCSFYMTMCQGGDQMMMMMMMSQHWQVKHELIWVKSSAVFSMGRLDYDYQHEPILFGWKRKHNFYGGGSFTKSVWEVPKPAKSDLHPTMKPIALIENALANSSKVSDIVLDIFGGSGSTLIACEKLSRHCHMMDIDPHYCDVIIKRWEDYTGSEAVLVA